PLGYVIERLGVVPLAPAAGEGAQPDTFTVFGDPHGKTYSRCANLMTPAACNWMVPAARDGEQLPADTQGLAPGYCL
ncbi:zinc-ribbon domain-containing protein, partial [Escherichia coli]|uniref:zinc-ribbon domain-containing protein n=2 Tax=Pseudomonadota TaxID=1224 RepID=UPI00019F395F